MEFFTKMLINLFGGFGIRKFWIIYSTQLYKNLSQCNVAVEYNNDFAKEEYLSLFSIVYIV